MRRLGLDTYHGKRCTSRVKFYRGSISYVRPNWKPGTFDYGNLVDFRFGIADDLTCKPMVACGGLPMNATGIRWVVDEIIYNGPVWYRYSITVRVIDTDGVERVKFWSVHDMDDPRYETTGAKRV